MPTHIRKIEARDEAAWRRLWDGYCAFYGASVSADVTAQTWRRILDPASFIHAIVATDGQDKPIAFAHYVVHENTWELLPVCYLEDLFVDPAVRGQGAGRQLIDWLVSAMRSEGWSRLYWMTSEDNQRARALYDKFTPRDAFVRYVVKAKK
jgi:GNAT superfamily N-acetyltransferase